MSVSVCDVLGAIDNGRSHKYKVEAERVSRGAANKMEGMHRSGIEYRRVKAPLAAIPTVARYRYSRS